MTRFVLFGTGSALIVEFVESCKRAGHDLVAGIDNRDVASYLPAGIAAFPVAGMSSNLAENACLCPLFTPANRYLAVGEAAALGFRFPEPLIDPTAIVASDVKIGGGSYVNAGVIIGASTTLDLNVLVNRGASIGHHNLLHPFVSIGPGAILAGQITVGTGAMIGAGAIVGPAVTIGEHAVVGAGAVVLRDVPPHSKVFGSPGKIVAEGLPGFGAHG